MRRITIGNKVREASGLTAGSDAPIRVIANLGVTPGSTTEDVELEKARVVLESGADIIADHSLHDGYRRFLERLLVTACAPVSTVPLYGVCARARSRAGSVVQFGPGDVVEEVLFQAKLGVDVMTLHASLDVGSLQRMRTSERAIRLPSRGGAFVAAYMMQTGRGNPIREVHSEILEIAKEYDIVLSYGTTLRPGSVEDTLDELHLWEIRQQSLLVKEALDYGVQAIAESVGHARPDMIPLVIGLQKHACQGVPIRPLPMCTDTAAGHDHIAGAIAGTLCALAGADLLTTITRAEHLGLPRMADLVEGVKAFRIAAHIGGLARGIGHDRERAVSEARRDRDWANVLANALFPDDARRIQEALPRSSEETCSMCGELCALRIVEQYLDERGDS